MRRRPGGKAMGRAMGKAIAAALTILLTTLVMSPASATIAGYTWYSDGTIYKQVRAGSAVSVYATGARPNRLFRLIATPGNAPADYPCAGTYGTQIHPSLRGSTTRGLIPTTTAYLNLPPGDYEICFLEVPSQPGGPSPSGTAPVWATVL